MTSLATPHIIYQIIFTSNYVADEFENEEDDQKFKDKVLELSGSSVDRVNKNYLDIIPPEPLTVEVDEDNPALIMFVYADDESDEDEDYESDEES